MQVFNVLWLAPESASAVRYVAIVGGSAMCLLYMCRVFELEFGKHRLSVILKQIAAAFICGAIAIEAIGHWVDLVNMMALIYCGLVYYVSSHSWRNGVPVYFLKERYAADLSRHSKSSA